MNLYNLSVSVIYLANHRSLRRRSLLQHREPDRFWTLCFRVFPIQRSLNCLHLRQIRCNQSIAQQYCRWWSRDRRDKNRTSSSTNDLFSLEFFPCRHFESKSRQTMKFLKNAADWRFAFDSTAFHPDGYNSRLRIYCGHCSSWARLFLSQIKSTRIENQQFRLTQVAWQGHRVELV